MIRAVIFDCFGVIISDALSVIVDELGSRNPAGADEVRSLVRASNKGIIDPNESNKRIADILGVELEEYRQQVRDGEVKDMRVLNLIKNLRTKYKTAMLSNINVPGLMRRFSEAEREEYFDVIVVSAEIGFAKPEAQAYEITADRLAVRLDECVFIDDREDFCEAARGVGMQAVFYQSFDQAKADLERILAK
jgi:putative hydrolase of the HAD superfamily